MDEHDSAVVERGFLDRQMGDRFVVDTPAKAEWAIKKIANIRKLAQMTIDVSVECILQYKDEIKKTEAKRDSETAHLEEMLKHWFDTVPHKVTDTQESVKLPSGTIKKVKGDWDYTRDENVLGGFLARNGYEGLYGYTAKWAELKKRCKALDTGMVIDTETGTIIEGVTAEMQPDAFIVKEKKDVD